MDHGSALELDEISKQIIRQLQEDGRRSYAKIAESIGLSDAAVRQRINKLIDCKYISVVAVTDPLQLGFRRQALIGIKTQGDLRLVGQGLEGLQEVSYIVLTSGRHDVLAEVVCEDDDHLLALLAQIRSMESVVSTETSVYLKLQLQRYDWGIR